MFAYRSCVLAAAELLQESAKTLGHLLHRFSPIVFSSSATESLSSIRPLAKSLKHLQHIRLFVPSIRMQCPDRAALSLPADTGCRVRADICIKTYQTTRSRRAPISAALRRSLQPSSHGFIMPEDQCLLVTDGDACFWPDASLFAINSVTHSRTTGYSCDNHKRRHIL